MGIPDLLKLVLRTAGRQVDLSADPDFCKDKRLAIDTSGWLHKAIRRDSKNVVLKGTSDAALGWMKTSTEALLGLGAIPVHVFDGGRYPPKLATQQSRRDTAAAAEQEARNPGAGVRGQALGKLWQKAATVQDPLVRELMQWCIEREVEFVVAPYEADHQLINLLDDEKVDLVLVASQDSDIAANGATSAIYDLDLVTLSCVHVQLLDDVLGKQVGRFDFRRWTFDRWLVLCCLSGCDYLENLPNYKLTSVYKVMAADSELSDDLLLPAGDKHPPLARRPTRWCTARRMSP